MRTEMSRSPDRKPLMSELILETLKRQERERVKKRRGWYWGSTKVSVLLGLAHIFFGTLLLIYDLATNSITESVFATSSSLTFIVCAILLFISARRTGLDRPAHYLIIIFSVIACALSLCLIGGTALHANKICISPRTAKCTLQEAALIHTFLVLIALLGMTLCIMNIYGSYHYLKRLSNQITNSIYKCLITEDFSRLPKHRPDEQLSLITVVESGSSPSAPSSLKTA